MLIMIKGTKMQKLFQNFGNNFAYLKTFFGQIPRQHMYPLLRSQSQNALQ